LSDLPRLQETTANNRRSALIPCYFFLDEMS
jgi:hypothetical protein